MLFYSQHFSGGSHLNDWQRTGTLMVYIIKIPHTKACEGYCGLGRTISSLGLATGNQNEIDYVV